MLEVRETRLPGVGSKFTLRTHTGEKVAVVLHVDGLRELYHTPRGADEEPCAIELNDEEARQIGAILVGAVYRPQLVQDLEMTLKDLVIEWIPLPPDSPVVGLTVATCRIRSTTGSTIVAILRDSGSVAMPHPDEVLQAGDTLVVIGRPDSFAAIRDLVVQGPPTAA
jgi:TrkA domain protein